MENAAASVMTKARLSSVLAGLVVLATLVALGLVLWLQFARGEPPCSLCVYQRLADLAVLIIVLMGFFWTGGTRRGLWLLAALYALAGAGLAGWQWHLTTVSVMQTESCAAVQIFTPDRALGNFGKDFASTLSGSGSCALAGAHTLAGWPITHWSVAFFSGCAILLIIAQKMLAPRKS